MSTMAQNEQDVFWVEYLDKSQEDAIIAMQAVLEERQISYSGHNDKITCARFLKARKWDVAKAVIMYENMVAFRKEKCLDLPDYRFDFPEEEKVKAVYPHFYHKTDKWGRPVYYELLGELNATELLNVTTVDRLIQYHVHCWERAKANLLPACSKRLGREVFTSVTILDLKNAALGNFTAAVRSFICAISKIDQDNYPEHLGQMFIVNAPMLFAGIWRVIKPWLEPRTQKKIHVISCAKQVTQRLLEVIPAENLLERFGGTSVMHEEGGAPWEDFMGAKISPSKKTMSSSVSSERIGASVEELPELNCSR